MERLINRRQQGDLGEASAIEWLTRQGAVVSAPLGHSPHYDLLADFGGRPFRVQVKTSVYRTGTSSRGTRHCIQLAALGGNQSWTRQSKSFDPGRIDALFVLAGDGRRWFIPAGEVEATTAIAVGGPKYSEFEIEPTGSIDHLVHRREGDSIQSKTARGSAGVWRAGPACKVGALALSEFESHLPHSRLPGDVEPVTQALRGSAPRGQTRVSGNRQIVIPKRAFDAAGLARGDRLKAFVAGPGEVIFRRVAREQNDDGPP